MSKIVFTNNGEVDQVVSNHGEALITVPAGQTVTLTLDPTKDITSQAYLKKFYGAYEDVLSVEYDIADYPMDLDSVEVTFNTNGGSSIDKQTVYVGGTVTKPEDPTKEESTFGGWYKEEGLVNEFDFDVPVSVDEDFTIYAKWSTAANAGAKVTAKAGSVDEVKDTKKDAKKSK